jgi:hypothetical protein
MNELTTYKDFFQEIIETINKARYKAFKSLNKFHIEQNFEIGEIIVRNQKKYGWGKSIVDTLSKDINRIIDGVKGYSPQNLWRMRQFYLELLDQKEKLPDDNPSIGIILCPVKDNTEVEYALRSINKPIGVSEYKLTKKLHEQLKGKVPTTKELKQML